MRLMLAAVTATILTAGPAWAEPLILRCVGTVMNVSRYDAVPTSTATQRFYKIDQQQFSRYQPADVVWPANVCTTKGAACSTDDDAYNAKWREGVSGVSVQINRKSARVQEVAEFGSAGTLTFVGECAQSADPAQAGGPNKF